LSGYIKYKIINLIEKKHRGWSESKVDQNLKIKSKQEVSEEYHQELMDKGEETITTNYIKKNIDFDLIRRKITSNLEEWKSYSNKKRI